MLPECLIVAVIFGFTPILNKYILHYIQTECFIIFLGLFYFLMALLYVLFVYQEKILSDIRVLNKNKSIYALLALSALLTFIVANYFYLTVIKTNKVYIVTAIIASYPLITALGGYFLLNETITLAHIIGMLFIISGVFILNV